VLFNVLVLHDVIFVSVSKIKRPQGYRFRQVPQCVASYVQYMCSLSMGCVLDEGAVTEHGVWTSHGHRQGAGEN
jgi:hypothetical protein